MNRPPQNAIPAKSGDSRIWPVVLALVMLTLVLRLPGVLRPLTGNFSTRAVTNAMMARNWALGRASLLYPQLDVLPQAAASGESAAAVALPQRSLHMVEFPVSAYLTGICWRLCGGSLDAWGRAVSIVFSCLATGLLYLLARRWHGHRAATAAAVALALSPVGIIYGQSFMFEPSLAALLLLAMWSLDRWLAPGNRLWLLTAMLCLALLVLTKIYMLVALVPLAAMAITEANTRRRWLAIVCLALAALPGLLWCWHVFQTATPDNPLAERLYYSYRQSAEVHAFPQPLLLSGVFYWGIARDLATVVLTPLGVLLAAVGLMHSGCRRHAPWLAACLAIIVALPLKFHEMNYYYLTLLPPLCLLVGLGWEKLSARWGPSRFVPAALFLAVLLISLRYSIRPAFITPAEDRAVVAAGRAVQQLAGPNEPVVTMHGSAIDLLYYCDRAGWAVSPKQNQQSLAEKLAGLQRCGARLLVVAGSQQFSQQAETQRQLQALPLVAEGDDFWIYRITPQGAALAADVSIHSTRK